MAKPPPLDPMSRLNSRKIIEDTTRIMVHDVLNTSFSFTENYFGKSRFTASNRITIHEKKTSHSRITKAPFTHESFTNVICIVFEIKVKYNFKNRRRNTMLEQPGWIEAALLSFSLPIFNFYHVMNMI